MHECLEVMKNLMNIKDDKMPITTFRLPDPKPLALGQGVVMGYYKAEELPVEVINCEGARLYTIETPGIHEIYLLDKNIPGGRWTKVRPEYLKQSGNGVDIADMVNHPPHYTSSKAHCANCKESIECIEIARHMSFNIGNAVKYLWRHELKGGIEDLKKAKWYINDAIKQLENENV